MQYEAVSAVVVFIALLLAILSLKLLLKGDWLLGLIKGLIGLVAFLGAIFAVGIALDFYSYQQLSKETPVATISFAKKGRQTYVATITEEKGIKRVFNLKGDLWQLDARLIKWTGALASIGLEPGYKLDRISGRYLSLEQERSGSRSVFSLHESKNPVDIWELVSTYLPKGLIIDATYGSATYLPMTDDAIFAVTLSSNGLVARPMNEPAKQAVLHWQ